MELKTQIDGFNKDLLVLHETMKCDTCIDHPFMIPRQEYYSSFYLRYNREWFSALLLELTFADLPQSVLNSAHENILNLELLLNAKEQQYKKFDDFSLILKNFHLYADLKFQQINEYKNTIGLDNISKDKELSDHYNFLIAEKNKFLLRDKLIINYYREFQKLFSQFSKDYDSTFRKEDIIEISEDIFPLNLTSAIHETFIEESHLFEYISTEDFHLELNKRISKKNKLKVTENNHIRAGYIIRQIQKEFIDDKKWHISILNSLGIKESTYRSKCFRPKVKNIPDIDQEFYKDWDKILKKFKKSK